VLSEDLPVQLTEFRAGSVLAGYRLEKQVGRGGFAVVFRALDERLGRPVALKILSPDLASSSPEFRRRFIAESRAAAAVDDPHIIPVYEAGQADGVLFIAMRFVAGGDLRQVLEREGALPPDRAADFVSPVASALDAAHAAGLVHRDVKPGNILVDARAGRPDHVYLSDFGIVKGAALGSLTGVGSSNLGTPDYMAPEQISGEPVDGRTDQYSLACVAVQLLTGTVPFQRDSLPALIYAHLSLPPPSLVALRPDLPAAVDQVVAKAMAKAPPERYESCGDFADALREALGLASYHRRSSATAPPRPPPPGTVDSLADRTPPGTVDSPADSTPPGTVETPEAAVSDRTSVDPPPTSDLPTPTAAAMVIPDQDDETAPPPPTVVSSLPSAPEVPLPTVVESPPPAVDPVPDERAQPTPAAKTDVRPRAAAETDVRPAPPAERPPARRRPVVVWVQRHRLPVFALACAILAAAITIPFISSSPSASRGRSASPGPPAASTGFVSLGNLSQDPSPVDVYLYSPGDSSPQFVQHGVAYGTILPYRAVTAGDYTVKMRAAGSPASSNPVWSVSLTVKAGGVYTIVPLRASAQQGKLQVIDNNLTTPKGKSFVRVIQADLNQGQVTFHCSCAPGAPGNITTDAAPGTVSPQVPIPTGTWTMSATGPSAKTSLPVTLTAGTVHTEIVVAAPGGGIQIINLVAAAQPGHAPTGGASTGLGGIAPSYRRGPLDLPTDWRYVSIASLAFSPSGTTLAIASEKICLWDIAAAGCTSTLGSASITSVAFSPDGQTLAASDNSGHTYLWNIATNNLTTTLADPSSGGAYSVAFSPDGTTLAVGDSNGRAYLWNVATGKPIRNVLDPGSKGVSAVAFSPDGTILAVGDSNGRTYLWNVTTGKQTLTLANSGSKDVMSVAFSPDGKTLAVGDDNGHTYLWSVPAGKPMTSLPDPGSKGVISVAYSPDGMTLAVGDNNGDTYIWNVITGKLITTLADPSHAEINSVAFSANGQILATGDENGNVFLWYTSSPP
jgi:serine/threonine protein kinase/sugar lactone lactonase YvrE